MHTLAPTPSSMTNVNGSGTDSAPCSRTPSPESNLKPAGPFDQDYSPMPTASMSSSCSTSVSMDLIPSVPDIPSVVKYNKPDKHQETATHPAERRQKRLERNRESARLSRRRRKQYLEVLEENVHSLSATLDAGRRRHVESAQISPVSREMRTITTFHWQQLVSILTPPSDKFVRWMTLQDDAYFRGGRASSERLSAARIGERMLTSGTDRVTPQQSMWPLFCNEVGLSYEQEERVRSYQRTLLQTPESWLQRHSAHALTKLLQTQHDSIQTVTARVGQREQALDSILTPEQRRKAKEFRQAPPPVPEDKTYAMRPDLHPAANLYITNHLLHTRVLEKLPHAAPLITGSQLKKLQRRPLFESLGAQAEEGSLGGGKNAGNSGMVNSSSTGSLKRSVSEMSMEEEGGGKPAVNAINPLEAQTTCAPFVKQTLGWLAPIIPPPPTALPLPTPVSLMTVEPPATVLSMTPGAPAAAPPPTPTPQHVRKSSFLPPHLNVVPEEMWPADDDFLENLMEGDWAIGIDMDGSTPLPE